MKICFKILQNHCRQRVPCIIFNIDNKKYIINTPETLQRFAKEHNVKFSSGMNFFYTRLSAHHIMGKVGLLLTLFEHDHSKLCKIFGPKNIISYLRDIRHILGVKIQPYSATTFTQDNTASTNIVGINDDEQLIKILNAPDGRKIFFDWDTWARDPNNIDPQYLNIASNFLYGNSESTSMNYNQGFEKMKIVDELEKKYQIFRDEFIEMIPFNVSCDNDEEIFCYLLIPKKSQGNIIPDLLKKHGITGKQISAMVKNGQHVKEDGTVVKIEDITTKSVPGSMTLILDLPELEHFQKLRDNDLLNNVLGFSGLNEKVGVEYVLTHVIHSTCQKIVSTDEYTAWLKKFDKSVNHIFTDSNLEPILDNVSPKNTNFDEKKQKSIDEAHLQPFRYQVYQKSLHDHFPEYFPKQSNIDDNNQQQIYSKHKISNELSVVDHEPPTFFEKFLQSNQDIKASFCKKFNEYVQSPLDKVALLPDKKNVFKQGANLERHSGFTEAKEAAQKLKSKLPKTKEFEYSDDPEIIILGTGSMMPGTYRNVSAINLGFGGKNGQDKSWMMLDCGEGTFSQQTSHFPTEELMDEYLINLRVVFITHIHMDHNLGLFKQISERMETQKKFKQTNLEKHQEMLNKPLFLVVPKNCISMISRFSSNVGNLDVRIIGCQDMTKIYDGFELDHTNWAEMKNSESELILKKASSSKLYKEQEPVVVSKEQDMKYWTNNNYEKDNTQQKMDMELPIQKDSWPAEAKKKLKEDSDRLSSSDEDPEDKALDQGDEMKVIVPYEDPEYIKTIREYEKNCMGNIKAYMDYQEENKITKFYPMRVEHCPQSHGIAITCATGWKLAYSGDCVPSHKLIEKGKGATLLQHEATFSTGMEEQAKSKSHTTVGQAVKVALNMGAKRLVLTHFSQRYTISEKASSKKKLINKEVDQITADYLDSSVIWGVDHLRFKFSQIEHMPVISKVINYGVIEE